MTNRNTPTVWWGRIFKVLGLLVLASWIGGFITYMQVHAEIHPQPNPENQDSSSGRP